MRGVFALLLSCRVSLRLPPPAALNPSLHHDWERNKTDAWGLYPDIAQSEQCLRARLRPHKRKSAWNMGWLALRGLGLGPPFLLLVMQ